MNVDSSDFNDRVFHKISSLVYDVCGINLTESKKELVKSRIGKIIRQKKMEGFKEYCRYLAEDDTGESVKELLNAISTNLTFFFRENFHFEFLAKNLIPHIKKKMSSSGNYYLRAWSAGCSSGAEAYSIALTLLNEIPDIKNIDCKILATDIDTNMLSTASEGMYTAKVVEPVPPDMLHSFFRRTEDRQHYKIKTEIRDMVSFRFLNLIAGFPFKKNFDFIFCRNVMIYFDKPTQQKLIDKFYANLKPEGYLFIGHSEGLSGLNHNFSYIKPTIYQKK